jgi:hypothetical protein
MSLPPILLRDFAPNETLRPLTLNFRTILYQRALDTLRSTHDGVVANENKWRDWVEKAELEEETGNTESILSQHFYRMALQDTVTRFSETAQEHVENILEASTNAKWQKRMLDKLADVCAERARNYLRLSEEGNVEVPKSAHRLPFQSDDALNDMASKENGKYL